MRHEWVVCVVITQDCFYILGLRSSLCPSFPPFLFFFLSFWFLNISTGPERSPIQKCENHFHESFRLFHATSVLFLVKYQEV